MLNKVKSYINKFLSRFRKDYSKSYYSFITKSPCGLSNLKERRVSEFNRSYGDDIYNEICFNATLKEYECFKKQINALTPKEFYELGNNDEDREDFFWLVSTEYEDEENYKNVSSSDLHIRSVEFINNANCIIYFKCDSSTPVAFVKGSEVNCYTFICFNECRICHFSFYS